MGATPTLAEFYGATYSRVYLAGARPATFQQYSAAVRHWREITHDPPLDQVTTLILAGFKAALLGASLAPATVNKHLRLTAAILAKAGPPGPRNRDALGLIPVAPWTKPLREPHRLPSVTDQATVAAIYTAASFAQLPQLPGIRPRDWWQTLIVLAYTTAFRRSALLSIRWAGIDLAAAEITLTADNDKAWTERRKPLHTVAVEHLLRIRTTDAQVFPWPYSMKTLYRQWHRIQSKAGIKPGNHIGLHDLKRTAGTLAAETASPWAVQRFLDHSSLATSQHYVNPTRELRGLVDHLPIPDAFRRRDSLKEA